jgi:multiple sugar transport system permease protein
VILASPRRRRLDLSLRCVLLGAGAVVMVAPFAYMLATSLKSHAFVFELPPQFIPRHPTAENYRQAWTSNNFDRYFLN